MVPSIPGLPGAGGRRSRGALDGHIFVGFQNGVGPPGEPSSTTGNTDSTILEFNRHGDEVNQWDVVGKCDGLTADPEIPRVIATVNEDANSSLYSWRRHRDIRRFRGEPTVARLPARRDGLPGPPRARLG